MRKYQAIALIAVLLAAACSEKKIVITPVEVDGMNNSVLAGDMLIGGQPSIDALRHLAGDGYQVILSTRGEGEVPWDEKAVVDSLGMRFVTIPMPSPVNEITDLQVELFDDVMTGSEGRVVLHCGSGNRASGLWAVWLVEKEGVAPEVAIKLAEQTGMKGVRAVVERRLGIEPTG